MSVPNDHTTVARNQFAWTMKVVLLAPAVMDMLVIHLPSDVKERVSTTNPIFEKFEIYRIKKPTTKTKHHTLFQSKVISIQNGCHFLSPMSSFMEQLIKLIIIQFAYTFKMTHFIFYQRK